MGGNDFKHVENKYNVRKPIPGLRGIIVFVVLKRRNFSLGPSVWVPNLSAENVPLFMPGV